MTGTFAIILGTSVINLLLAAVIFLRNSKSVVNRLFGLFAISIVGWTTFNYLADFAASNNLLYTRLTFGAAVFIALTLFYLSSVFPTGKFQNKHQMRNWQLFASVAVFALCMSPFLVPSVLKSSEGVELVIGNGYYIYLLYVLQLTVALIRNFAKSYRKSSLIERAQIKLLLAGILLYAIFAIASNLILPLVMDSWSSSKFGPVFTLVFVGFTAYAIVKHKLLDIKLIVARSLAYALSLSSVIGLFVISTFSVTSVFLQNSSLDAASVKWTYTALAVILAIIFGPLKRFFDRITARLFYRDAYDTQAFLDELNKVLVSAYELKFLLKDSLLTILSNLKPSYALFLIRGTEDHDKRIEGTAGYPSLKSEHLKMIDKIVLKTERKIIATDNLEDKYSDLQAILRLNDIALLARLTPSVSDEGVGYLALGSKKSGNIYSKQDLRVIEIIANELVIAIQNSLRFEEITNFNVTLQGKVNEATRKLKRTNEKLRALDETKDDFISMASHQLRTPLTSVKGYISMVLEGDAGDISPTQKEMLGQAFFSSQRMVYLIADLLNVSRLKTGKFIIEPTPVNLSTVIEEELGQLKETAEARQLKLQYVKPKNFPDLMFDETKIRQVIMNFVDNAIYYTPAGGTIKVKIIDNPNTVELRVIDSGIGVPKSEQPHLFTKFYRAGNARKARPDGTGLGLFMAKKVIAAQGGSTLFESHEGKGSTFGFIFNKSHLEDIAKASKSKNISTTSTTRTQNQLAQVKVK